MGLVGEQLVRQIVNDEASVEHERRVLAGAKKLPAARSLHRLVSLSSDATTLMPCHMTSRSVTLQRMGYRNHPSWRDMSDYVSHFTKDSPGLSAYAAMLSILASGRIRAINSFGCATNVTGLGATQTCACFSEIPLDMLDRLVTRRSRYGIGFHQLTLIPKGAARVWYLDPATPTRAAVHSLVRTAMTGGVDPNDDIWRLTPFADNVADNYHFEWEREWRIVGDLAFAPEDVAFLFVPAEQHDQARAFLVDGGGGAGPAYSCPLLDPLWTDEQVQEVLRRFVPDQP